MSDKSFKGKSVIKYFFFIVTTVCTILSFLYIIIGDPEWTKYVAYFFMGSFAIFLVLILSLLGVFLFRLEPGIKDGRYIMLVMPMALSIASGSLYFKDNNLDNRWGLIFLILGLSISVILIILVLFSWCNRSYTSCEDKDFIVTSVSNRLVRMNNNMYEFDVYKGIQSRIPILTSIETRFKWTGDKVDPDKVVVTSVTHNVKNIKVDDEDYDSVRLIFKRPLFYKQAFVCHYKLSNLSDSNLTVEPYLSQMVKRTETISLVSFDVVLKDVNDDYNQIASIQRKKDSAPFGAQYQEIDSVSFDKDSKSYHYDLFDPEPGYDYRLYWGKR